MQLLLIEDDAAMQATLQRTLSRRGIHVTAVGDGALALNAWQAARPDAVVLDLSLPGMDGLEVLASARGRGWVTPVLILTARGTVGDRVLGLNTGADDYLAKPFAPRELLARIQALVRRQQQLGAHLGPAGEDEVRFGPFTLHPSQRRLERDGQAVEISTVELNLLRALASQPNRPLGREKLLTLAHGDDHGVSDRSLDVQVMRLRRLIEADPASPRHIQTVWGLGYVFIPAP